MCVCDNVGRLSLARVCQLVKKKKSANATVVFKLAEVNELKLEFLIMYDRLCIRIDGYF